MTTTQDQLKTDIKQAIVRSLRLPITPEDIGDATPLFGEGLGLDSIDVLELVLEIERSFGVTIGDEQTGMKVSVRSTRSPTSSSPNGRNARHEWTGRGTSSRLISRSG